MGLNRVLCLGEFVALDADAGERSESTVLEVSALHLLSSGR